MSAARQQQQVMIPREVYDRIVETSRRMAGVPEETVMEAAVWMVQRMEPAAQQALVKELWFRGMDEVPPLHRGLLRRLFTALRRLAA